MKQKTVVACRGYTRPALINRIVSIVDRLITACQEWMEGSDRPTARLAALAVIFASFAYIALHLVLRVVRGG